MTWRIVFASATPDNYGKVDPLTVLGVYEIQAGNVVEALKQATSFPHMVRDARYVGIYSL